MSETKNKLIDEHNAKPTIYQKRFYKAATYLKANGIDIYSRADDHYRRALIIATGLPTKVKASEPVIMHQDNTI